MIGLPVLAHLSGGLGWAALAPLAPWPPAARELLHIIPKGAVIYRVGPDRGEYGAKASRLPGLHRRLFQHTFLEFPTPP